MVTSVFLLLRVPFDIPTTRFQGSFFFFVSFLSWLFFIPLRTMSGFGVCVCVGVGGNLGKLGVWIMGNG